MKPNYKNWMPKGMIVSFAAGAAVALALMLIISVGWLKILLLVLTLVLAGMTVWTMLMYRAFSYDGKRQMSRQIIDGVAEYVKLPEGGRCLDVGCGSGALAIAVAKRNPQGTVTGIDRWVWSTPHSARNSARTMPRRKVWLRELTSLKGMP